MKNFLSVPPVHQGTKKTLIDESFSRYEGAFCCPVPWRPYDRIIAIINIMRVRDPEEKNKILNIY